MQQTNVRNKRTQSSIFVAGVLLLLSTLVGVDVIDPVLAVELGRGLIGPDTMFSTGQLVAVGGAVALLATPVADKISKLARNVGLRSILSETETSLQRIGGAVGAFCALGSVACPAIGLVYLAAQRLAQGFLEPAHNLPPGSQLSRKLSIFFGVT